MVSLLFVMDRLWAQNASRTYGWGSNSKGQLGDDIPCPEGIIEVFGLGNAIAVKAGQCHSIALAGDGTVWAWGNNVYGQLGIGVQGIGTPDRPRPVQVFGPFETDLDEDGLPDGGTYLTGIIAIAASHDHNLALTQSGNVYAWGANHKGQLGCGSWKGSKTSPVRVLKSKQPELPLGGIVSIAAGSAHSMALSSTGEVFTWGYNQYYQLGNPTIEKNHWVTVAIQVCSDENHYFTGVTEISAGANHCFAIMNSGQVKGWGNNERGQLGCNGCGETSRFPVEVMTIQNTIEITGGIDHSLALDKEGYVWVWGDNRYGQMGNGIDDDHDHPSYEPARVKGTNGIGYLRDILKISSGFHHNAVVRDMGSHRSEALAWGNNGNGRVGGVSGVEKYLFPIVVAQLDKRISDVSGGGYHSLAVNLISGPDLVPTGVTYEGSLVVGEESNFHIGISNIGGIGTGIFNIKWEVNGIQYGYGSHQGIPAYTTLENIFHLTFTPDVEGLYTITFIVDVDNHVFESNETNNTRSIQVEVEPQKADLIPLEIKMNTQFPLIDESLGIFCWVRNSGFKKSGEFKVKWFLNDLQIRYLEHPSVRKQVDMLAPCSHIQFIPWRVGKYRVRYELDVDNQVEEINEFNNSTQREIQLVPLVRAHSHNDYVHKNGVPLYDALKYGYMSIEVDVCNIDGELMIGHTYREAKKDKRKFEEEYLQPLYKWVKQNNGSVYADYPDYGWPFFLLIDVKENLIGDANESYDLLHQLLENYPDIFSFVGVDGIYHGGAVMVVVSGWRPDIGYMKSINPRYAFYDGRKEDLADKAGEPVTFMPLISEKWPNDMFDAFMIISSAHGQGRRVRFWGTKDTESMWEDLITLQVDLIGTDDRKGLQVYLRQNDPLIIDPLAEKYNGSKD